MERIISFLKQYSLLVGIGAVGLGILIYGIFQIIRPEKNTVEIVKGENREQQNIEHRVEQIKIDVAGAVEKPGVYTLPTGSRIGDAIVAAGGLSSQADREWIAKTLNLAQEVKDGGKVYILAKSGGTTARKTPLPAQAGSHSDGEGVTLGNSSNLININTASVAELDKLSGIGEVRAQAIVANRPYGDIHELVTKAKVPESVYAKIKDSIAIY